MVGHLGTTRSLIAKFNTMVQKVCHLTSAHPRYDTRIFLKQCRSLAVAGYRVTLVVADGKGNEVREGVEIIDVGGREHNRLARMTKTVSRVYRAALQTNSVLFHLHDPELMPIGLKLKRRGYAVIFDAHEDVPKQLLSKPYLNLPIKWVLSKSFAVFERFVCRHIDGIIAATPYIREKFTSMGDSAVDINNYPLPEELRSGKIDWKSKQAKVAYVGGISKIRGIIQMVEAMGQVKTDVKLQLAGTFEDEETEQTAQSIIGWGNVEPLGFLGRKEIRDLLAQSVAGLVTFLPAPNHIDAQPNKMFEYMSAGLPVIASNFPLWKQIVDGNKCGLCVDPFDPKAVADAIDYLVSHPKEAEQMAKNGQTAVLEKYNWNIEEKKLFEFYNKIIGIE